MSQVLYQPKPLAHTTSATSHTNNSATSSRPHTSNLASANTIASAPSASSRPRRAAALASEATIHAVASSGRRKTSQSSSNKSNSHPSSKATPGTSQKPAASATARAPSIASVKVKEEKKQPLQPLIPPPQRVMAALPRSKRARRGAAPNDVYADNSVVMMDGTTAPANGLSHEMNALMMKGYTLEQAIELQSSSSSASKIGNGSGASVREMINGQETEVFVIDSDSPPNTHHHGNGDTSNGGASTASARGKRKAVASPNGAANGIASIADAAATTKKRRKDDAAAVAAAATTTTHPRPVQTWDKGKGNNIQYPDNFSAATKGTVASYRGGYNSNYSYQSPNGTRWTDSVVDPYHAPVNIDDSEGHYIVREGGVVAGRYEIKNLLGQGTFGKVVRCKDRLRDREVAIKIIRSIQKYTDAAQIEIRVLRALRDRDPNNENKCIHLIDTFTYHNHVCIVSELLGKSVFDFLKENEFHPFPCKDIWSFAKQLLRSVAFLHELGLVHTDLKPENILLVNNNYDIVPLTKRANSRKKRVLKASEIRLIDFGSATFNEEYHSQIVSTRHYRAPEIILQMGWSFPCDAWSIGCILIEFYTGEALFQTHDNLEHLAMMEMVLGPMPDDFRRKAETYKPGYFYANRLDFPNVTTNKQSRKYVKCMKTIDETINSGPAYAKHDQRFKHLLKRLLTFDPSQRIRVDQALKHSYFDLTESEIP